MTAGRSPGTHHGRTKSVPRVGPKATNVYETLRERLASGQHGAPVKTPEGLEPWRIHGERDLYDNQTSGLPVCDRQPRPMKPQENLL